MDTTIQTVRSSYPVATPREAATYHDVIKVLAFDFPTAERVFARLAKRDAEVFLFETPRKFVQIDATTSAVEAELSFEDLTPDSAGSQLASLVHSVAYSVKLLIAAAVKAGSHPLRLGAFETSIHHDGGLRYRFRVKQRFCVAQ